MARPKAKAPALRYHLSGQSVVTIDGRDFYLGKHDTPESFARYAVLIREYQAGGLTLPADFELARMEPMLTPPSQQALQHMLIRHVTANYRERVKVKYAGDQAELSRSKLLCDDLEVNDGETLVEAYGPLALQKQRQRWVYASLVNHASIVVKRVRARVYHALSSCPKPIRALILMHFQGLSEPVAIVDMHATYITLLVGALEDCDERDELIELLQTKQFYECVNDMLAPQHRYEDRGLLKKEFQKQCLFWLETDHRHRKLWQVLCDRFPRMALFIERLRSKYGVSGFSDWLTARESQIFIDDVLPQCEAAGIPAVPFHDAVGVPASTASQVKEMIELAAFSRLGFVPSVKTG